MANAIQIEGLSKTYSEGLLFRKKHRALNDVSLDVGSGEVFGLLGPNGAGKTTLIKILLGILHPTRGQAVVLEEPAGSMAARRRIGYLPENLIFPRHHTGRSALYFYGRLSNLSEAEIAKREAEVFELVNLTGRQHEPVRRYSKGMRQRLGLAQALLHDPSLLIMDEPTDGLDPMGRSQIRDLLMKLKSQGKTVFLNSHILQEVELICDRVAIMALGEVKGIGTIEQLINSNPLAQTTIVKLEIASPLTPELTEVLERFNAQKSPAPLSDPAETSSSRWQLNLKSQNEIDGLVDQIRENDGSIVRLEKFRPSLEQVFLSYVGSAPAHLL